MKYRRIPSKKRIRTKNNRQIRRIDRERRLRPYWYRGEEIDFSSIFGQKRLGEGEKKTFSEKLRARMERVSAIRKRIFAFLGRSFERIVAAVLGFCAWAEKKIRTKMQEKRKAPSDLHVLAGALLGVLTVAFVSAFLVLYKLLLLFLQIQDPY